MSNISKSISNNTMDEHLFEHSLSSSSSSTSSNIRGILKRTRTDLDKLLEEQRLKKIAKIVTIITFIVVYTPIIAFNLYFAYTDNTSCVLRESPIIGLSLYNYLTVQAYTMAFTLTLIILDDFADNLDHTFFKTFYKNYILWYRVFSLSWIAIGVIIFIFIAYKRLCSNGIFYYVAAVTVVLASSILISVIHQYKYDSKLNNNLT
jgi:hypothetical protein